MSKFIDQIFSTMLGRQKIPIEPDTADWIAVFQSCDTFDDIEERWVIFKQAGFT